MSSISTSPSSNPDYPPRRRRFGTVQVCDSCNRIEGLVYRSDADRGRIMKILPLLASIDSDLERLALMIVSRQGIVKG